MSLMEYIIVNGSMLWHSQIVLISFTLTSKAKNMGTLLFQANRNVYGISRK